MSTLVRRTVPRLAWVAWLTATLSLLAVPTASAYIDPGSGSVVFQALIAGAMGASLAIKVYWRRLTSSVSRLLGRSGDPDEAEADTVDTADSGGADTAGADAVADAERPVVSPDAADGQALQQPR